MATIMWACWDGGGNLTPSLGIAGELVRRGHEVRFHGRPDMVGRVEAAGLRGAALAHAWDDLERYGFHPLATVFGYTSSPAVGAELVEVAGTLRPDVVVVDAMFAVALQVAPAYGCPTVVMLHTFLFQMMEGWRANFAMQRESRERAGFDTLDDLDVLWGSRDVLHVNTLAAFDGEPTVGWENVVHGAPVLCSERRAALVDVPWPDDGVPVVLLSFSTVPEQRDPSALQRALDGLASLPVRVMATTGALVDPAELDVPANAWVVPFADHDRLMDRATMVVGHGGHGTTMRALRHGLPLVGMPAKGGDQARNLALVQEWGAGLALSPDADAEALRAGVERVLADPCFAAEARRRSEAFAGDGAPLAADTVERVLG
jgi:UDP:flavonoid glycosyltransferase YjiC (YdhE family)